ncbi:nicotinate-nucleotide adenylyltransferase [Cytobacillus spongiae]|uniref:nicotinate-nucleotide adenylyltransferase n=1 Tax=Cytobacillus spongiae TaxID=2901381 RepID=UPI001F45DD61|nr:nicotinate-nucleotide adenylyltransferase [Cytobacillus spongiae]UII54951.1 nicotinate-nucleotide adenylyltransferase [Cytobacillus spongiae]
MRKVGILGGTFNPPHYGHLIMANEVLSSFDLDEVWFMPNQQPPHKSHADLVHHTDRLNMLGLAIEGNEKFKIERIELEREGRSFTYDTMVELKERHSHEFYFIIGADMIEYLPKWYRIDELIKMVQFIGVNRPAYCHETSYPILNTEIPDITISSSMIRKRIKEGKTTRYFLPDTVRTYIKENHLYES